MSPEITEADQEAADDWLRENCPMEPINVLALPSRTLALAFAKHRERTVGELRGDNLWERDERVAQLQARAEQAERERDAALDALLALRTAGVRVMERCEITGGWQAMAALHDAVSISESALRATGRIE